LELQMQNASFDSIIPAIGSKYELGMSAFTITDARLDAVNMVSYFAAGSQLAVRDGNPTNIDPNNLCGVRVGVQIGTTQQEELEALNRNDCAANPIELFPYESQADVTANLVGGKLDAMSADSPITEYAIMQTEGSIEPLGTLTDAAPYGVVVGKSDLQLARAVQAALQDLMDSGTLRKIAAAWGNEQGVIGTAQLNPTSAEIDAVHNKPATDCPDPNE